MLCAKKALGLHDQKIIAKRLGSVKSLANVRSQSNLSQVTPAHSKNFQKYEVIVEGQSLDDQIQLIEWRSKTEFPIVKILFYKILHKKMLNQCPVIQVAIETFNATLYSIPKMPLFQIFYLMKESIIGFERLFDRFGTFQINSKMVLINKNQKCRVWMNENITLNHPSKKIKMTQLQFKNQIIRLFEEKCIRSFLSIEFYKAAYGIKTSLQLMHYIESFMKAHKIAPSNQFLPMAQSLGHKINQNLSSPRSQLYSTLKKIPKFIQEMRSNKRIENNESKSVGRHNQKQEMGKRDLSHSHLKKEKSFKSDTTISVLTPKSYASNQVKQESFTPEKNIKKEVQKHISLFNIQDKFKAMAPAMTQKQLLTRDKDKRLGKDSKLQIKTLVSLFSNDIAKKEDGEIEKANQKGIKQQKQFVSANTLQIPQIQLGRRKGEMGLKELILKTIPEIKLGEQKEDIFNKNGWLKRFNSLTVDKFRQTIHSHVDGNDLLSDQLQLSDIDLGILGAMGRQLRGSIFINPQQR